MRSARNHRRPDYMIAKSLQLPPVRRLSSCAWTLSRLRANSSTSNRSPAMKPRLETICTGNFAGLGIRRRKCRSRASASTCYATSFGAAAAGGRLLHAHGHGSSVHSFVGGCGAHLRARIVRCQGHHRGADRGGGTLAAGRNLRRAAVRRRRRARQPGGEGGEREAAPGCRFLVNGEPTENHIALASKGTLRVEVTATGRMAHSAYPELGESAIDKLIPALTRLAGDAAAVRSGDRAVHAEYWIDRRRARAERDSRLRARGFALPARRVRRRNCGGRLWRLRAIRWKSRFLWRFPSCGCAPSTDCRP